MKLPVDPQVLGLKWPEYAKPTEKRASLETRLNGVTAKVWQLRTQELEAAREKDRAAYAGAVLGGSSKAPAGLSEEVEAELEGAEREAEALETAVLTVDVQIDNLVAENASEWAQEVSKTLEEARASYRLAVEQLLERRTRYFALRRLQRYLENPGAGSLVKRVPADFQPPVIKTTHHGMFAEQTNLEELAALLINETEKE